MAKAQVLVSIIVPVHNEEDLLPFFTSTINKLCHKLKLSYEILLIENGSNDGSYQVAKQLSLKYPAIKVLRLSSSGYGQALITGFKEAQGKYVVIFNVDYHDERFLQLCQVDMLGYDVILASKLLPGARDKRSLSRRLITRFLATFIKMIFSYKGTDTHGVKVLRRSAISKVFMQCRLTNGIFDSELMIRAERNSLKILELPAYVQEIRSNRFGLKRFWQTPKDLIDLIRVLI
ncbi:MAG: glycosyltransferase family 2 protein [Patescibacteria group bacterium]|nr:glycosyltransferase family 2 protein [Patescibacteria group bacterium]